MEEFSKGIVVFEVWEAVVGEALVCEREPENASDRYTVAVKKEGTIIGGGTGGQWGQLPPQNIRCGGIAPTIAHSHDSDTASPLY